MGEQGHNALSAYKGFIDDLVENTPSVGARLVREEQRFSKAPDAAEINALVARLGADDRELLAKALDRERMSAVHDGLATLTWWLDTERITWASEGDVLPAGIEGGLHMDYVGRLDGWEWPDE
jgi:hypothetical protein